MQRDARERASARGRASRCVPRRRGTVTLRRLRRGGRRGARASCRRAHRRTSAEAASCSREIDRARARDALVCSSTSGLLPTALQADMARPERLVVGHPFNPVYLLPLVEVVAGEQTARRGRRRGRRRSTPRSGWSRSRVRREIDGFVADRLLEALWREALWLVHDGVATTGEIDDAIRYGPGSAGRRWAPSSPTGSPAARADMRHFFAQFGPALQWPWTRLTDVPELTDELLDAIVAQSDEQAEGLSVRELERRRDDNLVAILQALRSRRRRRRRGCCASTRSALLDAAAATRCRTSTSPRRCGCTRTPVPHGLGRLQRPHDREPLPRRASRTLGRVPPPRRAGRLLPRGRPQPLHGRDAHPPPRRGARRRPLDVETQVLGADEKRLHLFHTVLRRRDGRRPSRPASTCSSTSTPRRGRVCADAGAARRPDRGRSRTLHAAPARARGRRPVRRAAAQLTMPRARRTSCSSSADQLGAGALPAYGNAVVRAPHLDRLARARGSCSSARSAPRRCACRRAASLMTGLLPSRTGAYDNAGELPGVGPDLRAPPARCSATAPCSPGRCTSSAPTSCTGSRSGR